MVLCFCLLRSLTLFRCYVINICEIHSLIHCVSKLHWSLSPLIMTDLLNHTYMYVSVWLIQDGNSTKHLAATSNSSAVTGRLHWPLSFDTSWTVILVCFCFRFVCTRWLRRIVWRYWMLLQWTPPCLMYQPALIQLVLYIISVRRPYPTPRITWPVSLIPSLLPRKNSPKTSRRD